MIYLASPYTHPDRDVRQERFEAACRAAASRALVHLGWDWPLVGRRRGLAWMAVSPGVALSGTAAVTCTLAWVAAGLDLLASPRNRWALLMRTFLPVARLVASQPP